MEAAIQAFINSIQSFTKEQLFDLCVQLKRDNYDMDICIKEYRSSDKTMARDYQQALEAIKDRDKEIKDLKKALDHISSQKELLARHRFGSHNEKISALHASSGEDIQDPLAEEQDPGQASGNGRTKEKVVPFKKQAETETGKEDRAARAAARKLIREALGEARTKKTVTKMDLTHLPHKNTYDIDPNELDRKYGEDGWEIVGWHTKELLHKPVVTDYVENLHVPVIRNVQTGELDAFPLPAVLLKRSPITPELLAYILYEKYFKSVPLYRQSADLANHGLFIPRQDMSNWTVRFANDYFGIPYDYMKRAQCSRKYGQSDESTLQVLHEEGRDARTKSYVWVHTTGELDDGPPIVIFAYEPTRGTDHLRKYYAAFSGSLSSDAYVSYETLAKESAGRIILCGCLMHARRRFAEALEIIGIGKLSKEQIEALPEHYALVLLGKIYAAEDQLKSCTPEEREARRIEEVKPQVDQFYAFISSIDMADPTLSEKMKDAISYSLTHKETLCRFLEDGRIPCDNGYCENAIRLYAQGRRNWLFSNTPDGARASTIVYSMIETARRNGANPLLYMKYLLEETPSYMDLPCNSQRLEELMPWSDKYRKYEEDEMRKAIDAIPLKNQERPHYRPSRKKGMPSNQSLPSVG